MCRWRRRTEGLWKCTKSWFAISSNKAIGLSVRFVMEICDFGLGKEKKRTCDCMLDRYARVNLEEHPFTYVRVYEVFDSSSLDIFRRAVSSSRQQEKVQPDSVGWCREPSANY